MNDYRRAALEVAELAPDMPFDDAAFDFVTCWSTFKNFAHPVGVA